MRQNQLFPLQGLFEVNAVQKRCGKGEARSVQPGLGDASRGPE